MSFREFKHLIEERVVPHDRAVDRTGNQCDTGSAVALEQETKKRDDAEHVPELVVLADDQDIPDIRRGWKIRLIVWEKAPEEGEEKPLQKIFSLLGKTHERRILRRAEA